MRCHRTRSEHVRAVHACKVQDTSPGENGPQGGSAGAELTNVSDSDSDSDNDLIDMNSSTMTAKELE